MKLLLCLQLILVAGYLVSGQDGRDRRIENHEERIRRLEEKCLAGGGGGGLPADVRKSRDVILVIGASEHYGGVELYDIANNSWSVGTAPSNRHGGPGVGMGLSSTLSAGVLPVGTSSMVYVCAGGYMSNNECRRYDPEQDKWYNDMKNANHSRGTSAMVQLQRDNGRYLYKVGGSGADMNDFDKPLSLPIERYDRVKNVWKFITYIPHPVDGKLT